MKKILSILAVITALITSSANAEFTHPGISHKLSDLDRMKYMIEADIEPWASSFEELRRHRRAQHDYEVNVVNQDPSYVIEYSRESRNWFLNDGEAAYYNALMWYITGDSRHAEKAIEIFNTYKGLRRNTLRFALEVGRVWRIIEAAEIIRHTYDGWEDSEIQEFSDMLVYPGYSNTEVPTDAINSNDVTFYWYGYQGDPARHGNQGLFAMRTMMAMGIFLDNEIMYDRALRYLRGQGHRADDLPYPSGPPINNNEITGCQYFDEFTQNGFRDTIPDYGYNEVMSNYIFENGQSQESSRDQAHGLAGVITINVMSEMAWNQGDDLYGHLDNRPLLGMEFYLRYNLSLNNSFSDQRTPWEPTIESGEYIERTDRSGRWRAQMINPGVNCNRSNQTRGNDDDRPIYEMSLAHYKDRLNLPSNDYKWLQRGHDLFVDNVGVETTGVVTDHPVYGSMAFRRVSPGDPIQGLNNDGSAQFAMNVLPMTIEAENFDHFVTNGDGRSYNDTTNGNSGNQYRRDENVDIERRSGGGFNVGFITNGEWLTYTVYVPETGNYDMTVNYAAFEPNGRLRIEFDGDDETGNVTLPVTGGAQSWENLTLARNVRLEQGVQQMRVFATVPNNTRHAFNLNSISIVEGGTAPTSTPESAPTPTESGETLVHIKKRNALGFALDGNNGAENAQSVYLWGSNENNVNQQWIETDRGNGFYSYRKQGTNHCLDGGRGGVNQQDLYLWECQDGNRNQHWLKSNTDSGFVQLIKRNAQGFAINGGSRGENRQNVNLYHSSSSSQNLQWRVDPIR